MYLLGDLPPYSTFYFYPHGHHLYQKLDCVYFTQYRVLCLVTDSDGNELCVDNLTFVEVYQYGPDNDCS